MKILTVADYEDPYIWDYFDKERFKNVELTISCGDLKAEYLSFIVTMINAPLFYVPGNHDSDYLKNPPEGCQSIDGKFEVYKNIRILGFGGSYLYSGENYQYTEKEMGKHVKKLRRTIKRHGGLDILVAHAPAFGIDDGKDICHIGFKIFITLIDQFSPRFFIHGHQHINYGPNRSRLVKYKNTTVINAYGYHILDYQ